MKKLQHHHKRYLLYGLLVVSIGLCVGGVFVPVLIPIGCALMGVAAGVAQSPSSSGLQEDPSGPPSHSDTKPRCQLQQNVELDIHLDMPRNYLPSQMHSEDNDEDDIKDAAERKARPKHLKHRRHP